MALKKKQLDELKAKLLEERARVLQHLSNLENESDKDLGEIGGDMADIASLEVSQAAIAQMGFREKKLLKLINHALKKMEDDEYGICEYSGEEIPFKRLQISPWAKYTVEAKEELERQERGFRKSTPNDSDDEAFDSESEND
ncbi:MAG: TraR/DksA family transcriptional regulator [Bdellovibrionales bacterium]|nr:TraR/DksA family transcriptional regulator [Bdellovibrionales bacterium]